LDLKRKRKIKLIRIIRITILIRSSEIKERTRDDTQATRRSVLKENRRSVKIAIRTRTIKIKRNRRKIKIRSIETKTRRRLETLKRGRRSLSQKNIRII